MVRIFRHYVPKTLVILGGSELAILLGSVYLGVTLRLLDFNPTDKLMVGNVWPKAVAYALSMMVLMAGVGLYRRGLRGDLRGVMFRVGTAFLAGLLLMLLGLAVFPEWSVGSRAFTVAFGCSAFGVFGFRALVFRYSSAEVFKRRVVVLGAGRQAAQIERLRRKSDWASMTLVGFIDCEEEDRVVSESRLIKAEGTLRDTLSCHGADELVVAVADRRQGFPVSEILDCKMSGIQVVDVLGFFEQQSGKIQLAALRPSSLIFADGFIQAVLRSSLHRGFDLLVSGAFLALAWPLMLATAAAIWCESGGRGPVLYRQVRVGKNGVPFGILKFRSMRVDAESGGKPRWADATDARVTRVGALIRKLRIDELPQLVNVLKGQMSFVGPRPERPEFVAELAAKIPYYQLRHRVNPGITGWAQISYPYGASVRDAREKLQYDLYYIKNYSLFLDLTILLQTAQVVLWGQGAR